MASDAQDELKKMHDKLTHYGQFQWINVVLTIWDRAYRTAYKNVAEERTKRSGGDVSAEFFALIAPIIGIQSFSVQFAFAPLVLGLQNMTKKNFDAVPATVAKSPDDFISDRKLEFGLMLAKVSEEIIKLMDQPASMQQVVAARSRALFSPIWYPPKNPDEAELAKRIERRLWARILLEKRSNTLWADVKERVRDVNLKSDKDAPIDQEKSKKALEEHVKEVRRRLGTGSANSREETDAPLLDELSRPDPLSYPLPAAVRKYLDLLESKTITSPYFPQETQAQFIKNAADAALTEVSKTYQLTWADVPI